MIVTDDRHLGDDTLFFHGTRVAMGLANIRAKQWGTTAHQIAVWDGIDRAVPWSTSGANAEWAVEDYIVPRGRVW